MNYKVQEKKQRKEIFPPAPLFKEKIKEKKSLGKKYNLYK